MSDTVLIPGLAAFVVAVLLVGGVSLYTEIQARAVYERTSAAMIFSSRRLSGGTFGSVDGVIDHGHFPAILTVSIDANRLIVWGGPSRRPMPLLEVPCDKIYQISLSSVPSWIGLFVSLKFEIRTKSGDEGFLNVPVFGGGLFRAMAVRRSEAQSALARAITIIDPH